MDELFKGILKMLLPQELTEDFEVVKIEEQESIWKVRIEEKPDRVPEAIRNKEFHLDGFCNPIELQSFPAKGKETYLYVYRRRWKCKDDDKGYSNEYDLHIPGMKATKEFGSFLKEIGR